jgi:hypothetical protein
MYVGVPRTCTNHQPDIWGLTKGMASKYIYFIILKTIPFLVQQNVGLVPGQLLFSSRYGILPYAISATYLLADRQPRGAELIESSEKKKKVRTMLDEAAVEPRPHTYHGRRPAVSMHRILLLR